MISLDEQIVAGTTRIQRSVPDLAPCADIEAPTCDIGAKLSYLLVGSELDLLASNLKERNGRDLDMEATRASELAILMSRFDTACAQTGGRPPDLVECRVLNGEIRARLDQVVADLATIRKAIRP